MSEVEIFREGRNQFPEDRKLPKGVAVAGDDVRFRSDQALLEVEDVPGGVLVFPGGDAVIVGVGNPFVLDGFPDRTRLELFDPILRDEMLESPVQDENEEADEERKQEAADEFYRLEKYSHNHHFLVLYHNFRPLSFFS
jgi:hypothetical protein